MAASKYWALSKRVTDDEMLSGSSRCTKSKEGIWDVYITTRGPSHGRFFSQS